MPNRYSISINRLLWPLCSTAPLSPPPCTCPRLHRLTPHQPLASSTIYIFILLPCRKAKAIEEAPAAPGDAVTSGAWLLAGSRAMLSLSLLRPLVAPWQPPPRPAAPLSSLIQPRPGLGPYSLSGGAMQVGRA